MAAAAALIVAALVGDAAADAPPTPATPEAEVTEAAPPSPAAVPESVVTEVRPSLVAIQDVRFQRGRRANTALLTAGAVEFGLGAALTIFATDPAARGAGATVLTGGLLHGISGWYQLDLGGRRHASFAADLVAVDAAPPEAMYGLIEDARQSAEREARAHAFGTGLYGGVFAAGALTVATNASDASASQAGVALALMGAVGTVHHVARWRASARVAADLAVVDAAVPTVVPRIVIR